MPIPFILPNIKPSVVKLYGDLCYFFPQLTHFYGYAGTPDHNTKRCLDAMVYDSSGEYVAKQGRKNLSYSERIALGDRVLAFLRKNAEHYGLNGVIWNRKVYGFPHGDAPFGRNWYRGPYNVARAYTISAHDDHLHIDQDGSDFTSLIPTGPTVPQPSAGTVWVDLLVDGVTDSDSIRLVQKALGVQQTGTWDAATKAAAGAFQESLGDDVDGYLGTLQASALFTKAGLNVEIRTDASGEAPTPVDPPPPVVEPPKPPVVKPYPTPTSGEVYLNLMKAGVTDSDTAWYVRSALKKIGVTIDLSGDYPLEEVKTYQQSLGDDPKYCDGILGPTQATKLFTDAKMPVKIYADSAKGGLVYPKAQP